MKTHAPVDGDDAFRGFFVVVFDLFVLFCSWLGKRQVKLNGT